MKKGIVTQNRDALMSSEIFEKHRYKLTLTGHKLLIGLIQSIDHEAKIFGEVGYDIYGLFKFLNLENRNDRYDVVREAFEDIVRNPLIIRAGEKKWAGMPWLSYEFDKEQSSFVKIEFTEKIKPYLLDFQKYIHLKGRYITAFSSDYAITLYPVFRWILEAKHGKHELDFQRLKEITFTDDPKKHPAYNTNKSATNNFLRKVIGVQMNPKTKKIEILKDSPLLEINEKSDLAVSVVDFVKDGRKYTGVKFHVTGKTAQKKTTAVQKVPDSKLAHYRIPLQGLYEDMHAYNKKAKAAGQNEMTIQDYVDMAGYFLKGDGYAYKKMTAKEQQEAIKSRELRSKNQELDSQKRLWSTEPISEVFSRMKNQKN